MDDLVLPSPVNQNRARIGLRSYDVALGFRNLNDRSGYLTQYHHTHTIGMAGILAGAIKGRDIIQDARALRTIAAEVLKINSWAFADVIRLLEELGLISNVRRSGGDILSFHEHIPLFYDGLYNSLGESWELANTSELEQQLVFALDNLSSAPMLAEDAISRLGIGGDESSQLQKIGEASSLIVSHQLSDGTRLLATPL